MSTTPAASRCPACGGQAITRMKFLLLPGLRSRCQSCGRVLRYEMTRGEVLTVVVIGAVMAGILFLLFEGWSLLIGILAISAVVFAFDSWMWRNVGWQVDEKHPPGS